MAEQYTSLKTIYSRLLRHPLLQDLTMDAVIDYTIDFMRIVGVPNFFINKVADLSTDNYKIKLPCDFIDLVQMKGHRGMYRASTDTFHLQHKHPNNTTTVTHETFIPNKDYCLECPNLETCKKYHYTVNGVECISMIHNVSKHHRKSNTFIIQNNYIYLSNKHDNVSISYLAILTDNEGYPMIPDNSNFIRALMAYIKKEEFTIKFDLSAINPQILQQAQQDYAWAVGSCETDANKMNLSKAESFLNSIKTIINKNNEFVDGFESNGDKVIFKTH